MGVLCLHALVASNPLQETEQLRLMQRNNSAVRVDKNAALFIREQMCVFACVHPCVHVERFIHTVSRAHSDWPLSFSKATEGGRAHEAAASGEINNESFEMSVHVGNRQLE